MDLFLLGHCLVTSVVPAFTGGGEVGNADGAFASCDEHIILRKQNRKEMKPG